MLTFNNKAMFNVLKSAGEGLSKARRVVSGIPKQVASSVAAHSRPIRVAALMALVSGNAGCLTEFPARKGACETVGQGKSAGCDNENEVCRINMESPNNPSDLTCYDRTEYCEYTVENNINDIACPPSDALPSEDAALVDAEPLTPDAAPPTPDAAPPTPDAAPPTPDAAPPTPDAAPPTPDAAPPTPDAAPPTPDAAPPTPDAVAPTPDAALSTPDAVAPTPDAALPTPDAAPPTPDAVAPTPDAAGPMFDLGVPPLDGALIPVDAAEDANVDGSADAISDASIDAVQDASIDASSPDAEVVVPINYCRIKIVEVLGGAGNNQLFCGPGIRQVDANPNAYILGPDSLCDRRVADMANEAWTLISPTRTTFQQEGDCSGLRVFSGDRADVPTDLPPTENAEEVHFIIDPPRLPQLIIDGRNAGSDIATYFDARATNLSQ